DLDPGPVPVVVEPELPPTTVIPVTPQTHLEVTRRGDCTRLALVSVRAGARVATDMPPQAVDALVWALVAHTPAPYVLAGGGSGAWAGAWLVGRAQRGGGRGRRRLVGGVDRGESRWRAAGVVACPPAGGRRHMLRRLWWCR